MKKGVVRVLEVFLTIQLLIIFLSSMQVVTTPDQGDPYNLPRLKVNAEDIVLSISNNIPLRKKVIENKTIPQTDTDQTLTADIDHAIKLYNGTYFTNQIDSKGTLPNQPGTVTTSYIISGHAQNNQTTSKTPSSCSYGNETECLNNLENSDDIYLSLSSGETVTLKYPILQEEKGFKNTLVIEAHQESSGSTSIEIQDETSKIEAATVEFNQTEDETKKIDLTGYLPDAKSNYNTTITPNTNTSYDQIQMNVTQVDPHYDPHKLLAGVWNR